ncbi:MAG: cysteine desulfurase [Candidatus Diapherotrites archaeon]
MNPEKLRKDFPSLKKGIIYFDNACMTLRPKQVIEAICSYYNEFPSCPGRSLHSFGNKATEEMEKARKKISNFIGAKSEKEIVFTRNATEAINLVSKGMYFKKKKTVVISDREHNSNLVPWQQLQKQGIKLKIVPSKENEEFDLNAFRKEMDSSVRLVSIVHTSNIDGYTLPAKEIIKTAHDFGALVLLDGAQSAAHLPIKVKKLDCDFFAFSAHKMLGPSGMGCLYGKSELLKEIKPLVSGGNTVANTTYKKTRFLEPPEKFEAGLPDIAGTIGFGSACNYLEKIGMKKIEKHEKKLNFSLQKGLEGIEKISLTGVINAKKRTGITSFNLKGLDSHDIAILLDESKKIAVRSGMHCAHSWFNARKIPGCVRASLYLYNTKEEVQIFLDELIKIANCLE